VMRPVAFLAPWVWAVAVWAMGQLLIGFLRPPRRRR
jgi:hypothetical protein